MIISHFNKLTMAMAFISLTACQTMPNPNHVNQQSVTAKALVSQTIHQRFDKSYDFEKTFKYQLTPFYGEQDIEKNDGSLVDLLLAKYFTKKADTLSQEESECEIRFNTDFDKIYQKYDNQEIGLDDLNQQIEQLSDHYQSCEQTLDKSVEEATNIEDMVEQVNTPKVLDKLANLKPNGDDERLAILKALKLTPQQIEVIDKYYLQNAEWTQKGNFHQANQQVSMVLEQKFQQPFVEKYQRLPILLDMNNLSITFEPDMFLPMLPLLLDTSLSQNLNNQSLRLQLPDDLKQKIPLVLLKDTLIKAIAKAYGDLDGQKFSDVPVDDYGRSLRAKRAIKVSLTAEDFGFILGRGMKYWVADLQKISQQHPDYINNKHKFDNMLALLAMVNQNYQSSDIAQIVGLIEAILPISIHGYHYYYFDGNNNLLGFHKIGQYHSALFNAKLQSSITNKIVYHTDNRPHTYYQPMLEKVIDGNQLIKDYQADTKRLKSIKDNYLMINIGHDGEADDKTDALQE